MKSRLGNTERLAPAIAGWGGRLTRVVVGGGGRTAADAGATDTDTDAIDRPVARASIARPFIFERRACGRTLSADRSTVVGLPIYPPWIGWTPGTGARRHPRPALPVPRRGAKIRSHRPGRGLRGRCRTVVVDDDLARSARSSADTPLFAQVAVGRTSSDRLATDWAATAATETPWIPRFRRGPSRMSRRLSVSRWWVCGRPRTAPTASGEWPPGAPATLV